MRAFTVIWLFFERNEAESSRDSRPPMQHGRQECRPSDGTATLLSPMAVTKRYYGSPSGSAADGIVTSESLYPRAAHPALSRQETRFPECVVPSLGGKFDGFRLKAALGLPRKNGH